MRMESRAAQEMDKRVLRIERQKYSPTVTQMSIWDKPLLSAKDAVCVLPGKGRHVLDQLVQAGWLSPLHPKPARPLFRSVDLREALHRMERETPRPIHRWMLALGAESSHLVGPRGKPACGARVTEWLTAAEHDRKCTRCQGAAKTLNVQAS